VGMGGGRSVAPRGCKCVVSAAIWDILGGGGVMPQFGMPHDEYTQDEVGATLSEFGRRMARKRHAGTDTATTREQRRAIMQQLAALSPRTGAGRPATVPHLEQGYCRCAGCRRASGER